MSSITFQPLGVTLSVSPGTTILAAAQNADLFLRHVCGGQAICGTCRCKVLEGADHLSPMDRLEQKRLREFYAGSEVRLSCQARITGDASVEIPIPRLGL